MSTSHRICETCVYCSFAGNCDRYDKPLTSIEQPACDAYDIHPLLDENMKLRELVRDVFALHWHGLDCTECPKRFHDRCTHLGGCEWLGILSDRMRELGVEV